MSKGPALVVPSCRMGPMGVGAGAVQLVGWLCPPPKPEVLCTLCADARLWVRPCVFACECVFACMADMPAQLASHAKPLRRWMRMEGFGLPAKREGWPMGAS